VPATASAGGRQPESQQPLLQQDCGPQEKHDGMHDGPHGPQPIIGQQPVQHRLPQQTGLKALYGRMQRYVEYLQQPWPQPQHLCRSQA
jgi:hypothetical protein